MVTCPLCRGPVYSRYRSGERSVLECSGADCRLRFLHPQPTPQELRDLYRTMYYEPGLLSEAVYAGTPDQVADGLIKTLLARCGPIRDRQVLDFGAGSGLFASALRALGATVVCVEPDPEARQQLATRGLPAYSTLEALRADLPAVRFDVVTAIEVVEHLEDPLRHLRAVRERLTPGGILFLTTPNFDSLRARLQRSRWAQYCNPTHLFFFTQQSLERVVLAAGFSSAERLRSHVVYPSHGLLRRGFQRGLQFARLDGDLVVLGSAPPIPDHLPSGAERAAR
jgi:2-polyprenyl-3-methyl-5-hydroxy-6-metoxy-1,4-benzoquinol methylase